MKPIFYSKNKKLAQTEIKVEQLRVHVSMSIWQ